MLIVAVGYDIDSKAFSKVLVLSKILSIFILIFSFSSGAFARAPQVTLDNIVIGIENEQTSVFSQAVFPQAVFPMISYVYLNQIHLEPLRLYVVGPCNNHIEVRNRRVFCLPFGRKDLEFSFAEVTSVSQESDSNWHIGHLRFDLKLVNLTAAYNPIEKLLEYWMEINLPNCSIKLR